MSHFTLPTSNSAHLHCALYTARFTLHIPNPHFSFTCHTLHSGLHTPQFKLHTVHSPLPTLHSVPYFLHFALNTIHHTPYTMHTTLSTFNAPHTTRLTPHPTLYIPPEHSTLYTLQSAPRALHTTFHFSDAALHNPHWLTLHSTCHTSNFTPHTSHSTLHTLHCTFDTPHPQFTFYRLCTLHFISTLCTPHSTLYSPHSTLCSKFHTFDLDSTLYDLTLQTVRFALHISHPTPCMSYFTLLI